MYKACPICGGIHPQGAACPQAKKQPKTYRGGKERELRNTYKWHKKSEAVREEAQHLCEVCRALGVFVYDSLEVHHIEKVKDNEDLLLDDDNLICLCVKHHKQADAGKISADYLKSLVQRRREVSPGGNSGNFSDKK